NIKTLEDYEKYFHRLPDQLRTNEIRAYQVYLLQQRKQGVRTVGNHTAALRFFFCKTLKRSYPVEEVPYPRAPRKLPIILTQEEAVRLIDSASNLFHRAMLMTLYSTGMRRAELCHLKVEDIDTVQLLLGHSDLKATSIYLHLSERHLKAAGTPLDKLQLSGPEQVKRSRKLHKR